ncbi:MAG: hypothetical protein ACI3Z5_01580 [Paludibacteraceae bacterium]
MSEEKDMNLFDLCAAFFRWIGRCCMTLIRWVGESLRLTWRWWFVVLPVMAIVLGVGLWYSRTDNRIYEVNAVAHLYGPTVDDVNQVYSALANALPASVSSTQTLPALLQVDPATTRTLRRFETYPVIDSRHDSIADYVDFQRKVKYQDTTNVHMASRINLQFRTKQPDLVPQVGTAIVNYLNSNASFQAAYAAKLATLQREARFCHDQIEKVDSLSTAFYFDQGTNNNLKYDRWELLVGTRQIELIHPQIFNLFYTTKKVDKELALATAPVVLEQGFVVKAKPINGWKKWSAIGLVVGYLLGCLLALLIDRRKAIFAWLNKQ